MYFLLPRGNRRRTCHCNLGIVRIKVRKKVWTKNLKNNFCCCQSAPLLLLLLLLFRFFFGTACFSVRPPARPFIKPRLLKINFSIFFTFPLSVLAQSGNNLFRRKTNVFCWPEQCRAREPFKRSPIFRRFRICVCVFSSVCSCVCVCVYLCLPVCVYVCADKFLYVCVWLSVCPCAYVCTYAYAC